MSGRRRIAAAAALCACVGCVSTWQVTSGSFESRRMAITTSTPLQWYQISRDKAALFTREGRGVGSVMMEVIDLGDTLRATGTIIDTALLLHEIPLRFLDNYAAASLIYDVEVACSAPVLLDGEPAARIDYAYTTAGLVRMRSISLFCVRHNRLYIIDYSAPQRHYFERYQDDFEKMVADFRFRN